MRSHGRARVLVAAVGLAVVIAGSLVAVAAQHPASAGAPDSQCTAEFPVKLFPGPGAEERVRRMVVCSNRAGTATLIRNDTRAVWLLQTPGPRPHHRLETTAETGSFLDLVGPEDLDLIGRTGVAVPSGSSVVSLSPAATTRLRVDARLTLAELAYDQFLTSLDSTEELRRTAVATSPSSTRRALGSCVHAILAEVGEPHRALWRDPIAALKDAARRLAARPSSACALDWLEAKVEWGAVPADGTPFADDVGGWDDDGTFARYILSAGDTYRGVSAGADATAVR